MDLNPFNYAYIDKDTYLSELEDKPKIETVIVLNVKDSKMYKNETELPKVLHDNTCLKIVDSTIKQEEKIEEPEIPHVYAESIEGSSVYHVVKKGETLKSIAKYYNVTIISIIKLNNLKNKKDIKVDQKLKVL